MKPESVGGVDDVTIRNPQVRSGAIVRGVAVRDDRVQPVIATRELDDDKNSLGMLLYARSLKRLRRQRRRRPAQDEGQPRPHADAVEAADEKVAAGARAVHMWTRGFSVGHITSFTNRGGSIRAGTP